MVKFKLNLIVKYSFFTVPSKCCVQWKTEQNFIALFKKCGFGEDITCLETIKMPHFFVIGSVCPLDTLFPIY